MKRYLRSRLVLLRAKLWFLFYYESRPDVRALQKLLRRRKPEARACFIFSTKNRVDFTKASLDSMNLSGGFDVIWLDASSEITALNLFKNYRPQNFNIIARIPNIKHGPDVAIQLGLTLLYHSNYEFIGLIENDVKFSKDWLPTLLGLFEVDPSEMGVKKVGAASLRNYRVRNLAIKENFSYAWNLGAGMILFRRKVVKKVLRNYGFMPAQSLRRFFKKRFKIDVSAVRDPLFPAAFDKGSLLPGDAKFCLNVWRQGYACVASVPSLARNMDTSGDEDLYL